MSLPASSDGSRRSSDLPSDKELARILKIAKKLNDDEVKAPPMRRGLAELKAPRGSARSPREEQEGQGDLRQFPPGQRRDYIAWVIEAKQAATRAKRIDTAVEWMAEGKIRNWKYVDVR